ncbi:unnamed protein product [Closterium sp. NIES-64]|nr:unnamed protein product [Closterium sp. NIES-64]
MHYGGNDGVEGSEESDESAVRGTQVVRFMVVGQVVCLSPDCTVQHAQLKPGVTIKVLPVKAVRGEGKRTSKDGGQDGVSASAPPPAADVSLSELKEAIWRGHEEMMMRYGPPQLSIGAHKASAAKARGSARVGGEQVAGTRHLVCREDMVHYLESLTFLRSRLHKQLPDATPLAPRRSRVSESMVKFSARVQAFGERGEGASPGTHFSCSVVPLLALQQLLGGLPPRCHLCCLPHACGEVAIDTMWKADVDIYDALYLARASQQGMGWQQENDRVTSVLVLVLGVKERADLQEGFGFFVQHVLSGGLEKAHAERGTRGGGEQAAEKARGEGKGGSGKCYSLEST